MDRRFTFYVNVPEVEEADGDFYDNRRRDMPTDYELSNVPYLEYKRCIHEPKYFLAFVKELCRRGTIPFWGDERKLTFARRSLNGMN